jgi:monooxygenase
MPVATAANDKMHFWSRRPCVPNCACAVTPTSALRVIEAGAPLRIRQPAPSRRRRSATSDMPLWRMWHPQAAHSTASNLTRRRMHVPTLDLLTPVVSYLLVPVNPARALPRPERTAAMPAQYVDVLIVGAGLSGIGAAYHLQAYCRQKSYIILEGRERSGGTWDLFRYPGVRSDSDMFTLGYSFKPWRDAKAIADGPSILKYVRETAHEHGIDKKMCFQSRVKSASWSSEDARWTVEVTQGPQQTPQTYTCNFLFMCSGYYKTDSGYSPKFEGVDQFKGKLVHPQQWPEDLDYAGKRVVVIGSGATAITLVPAMAEKAGHVTMLQRSPTYVVSRPSQDERANWLRAHLPAKTAHSIIRWRNVLWGMYYYRMSKKRPEGMKQFILKAVQDQLGPEYDVNTHFTPKYNPWDQRLCLVPDADLFKAINNGTASVVTDEIATFTQGGVMLKSGPELLADIIVTATGLDLIALGGVQLTVDGKSVDPAKCLVYKGMMYSDVPNMAAAFGYTNASWTLKCDLTCDYVCRMLNYMDKHGFNQCVARRDPSVGEEPWVDFSSGYIQRAVSKLPKQGTKMPWKLHQNYARDLMALRFGSLQDDVMVFSAPKRRSGATAPSAFAKSA